MNETKVNKILPEHVGMEVFFCGDNEWAVITAVGKELFLCSSNNVENYQHRSIAPSDWTIRPKQKEEKPKLPSERISEIIKAHGGSFNALLIYLDEVLPPLLEKLK